MLPSTPLPEILINSDDHRSLLALAEAAEPAQPYVAAYLERELHRAAVCQPWDRAGVSMGDRVMFSQDDEPTQRLGRLVYPHRALPEKGNIPILTALGAALIGMQRGSSIDWFDDGKLRRLTVLDYGW